MKQDYHSFILSRLLDLRNQHQRAYKQIVEKCIAESILPQWIIFFCAVYDSLVTKPLHESNHYWLYKRGAVQCAAAGIRNLIIDQFSMTSMRVWSRKTLSEWLAFKEASLNVLCLAIVLQVLFEKYSINLFSSLSYRNSHLTH